MSVDYCSRSIDSVWRRWIIRVNPRLIDRVCWRSIGHVCLCGSGCICLRSIGHVCLRLIDRICLHSIGSVCLPSNFKNETSKRNMIVRRWRNEKKKTGITARSIPLDANLSSAKLSRAEPSGYLQTSHRECFNLLSISTNSLAEYLVMRSRRIFVRVQLL